MKSDKQVAIDLMDTLKANEAGCVGMAANMIGVTVPVVNKYEKEDKFIGGH